jgi:hypothetical protein
MMFASPIAAPASRLMMSAEINPQDRVVWTRKAGKPQNRIVFADVIGSSPSRLAVSWLG